MQQLLQEAAAKFDWVIVDSTPMRAATDANLICPLVDAAILVVKAGQTPHSAVEAAIGSLGRERIVGVVLNAVSPDDGNGPYRSYGHARAAAQAARDSN
jgi:receptor protein-tyrosine kinase